MSYLAVVVPKHEHITQLDPGLWTALYMYCTEYKVVLVITTLN